MVSVLSLPDWTPAWVQAVILCVAGLFAVSFLALPFAVFGIRGRLEMIEARLDEIQGEIRSLSLRLPEPSQDDDWSLYGRRPDRPPIPPAPRDIVAQERARPIPVPAPPVKKAAVRADRTEPRLY